MPKHLEPDLILLRDPRIERFGPDNLLELQRRIRDPNWRIFAEDGRIHALNNSHYFADPDPFVLFERMGVTDPSHAFYLGYELMKAKTALTLGKNYRQDQALRWGFLTEPEKGRLSHRAQSRQAVQHSSTAKPATTRTEPEGTGGDDGPEAETNA